MAYVAADFYLPRIHHGNMGEMTGFSSTGTIDATGEKIVLWGPVKKTGNIRNIGLRFHSVTKAGGSGLTVSLQDMDTANGPTARPDGTADQTVAVANGDANFASNTFYLSGNLSADRAVTRGDMLGVVIEFDGGGRLGADTVSVSRGGSSPNSLICGNSQFASSAWSFIGGRPLCVFKYDDGTYAGFEEGMVASAATAVSYNSGSATDEYALEFSAPFSGKIDGGWCLMNISTAANFDFVLYEGTTALATKSFDGNATFANADSRIVHFAFSSAVEVVAGTTYRISLKPTTTNSVSLYYLDVPAADYLDALPGEVGTEMALTSRGDAGSWAAVTTTRRPQIGVHYCAIDVGSGGGLLAHPGMRGGFA